MKVKNTDVRAGTSDNLSVVQTSVWDSRLIGSQTAVLKHTVCDPPPSAYNQPTRVFKANFVLHAWTIFLTSQTARWRRQAITLEARMDSSRRIEGWLLQKWKIRAKPVNVMGFLGGKRIVSRLRNSTIEGISLKYTFKKKPMLLWGTVNSNT